MKTQKVRTKAVAAKNPATTAKRVVKTRPAAAAARKPPAARESAGIGLLAEGIATVAAIAVELRQIADDLCDLMEGREGPEFETLDFTKSRLRRG